VQKSKWKIKLDLQKPHTTKLLYEKKLYSLAGAREKTFLSGHTLLSVGCIPTLKIFFGVKLLQILL
jgi:hypothetical protein